MKKIEIDYHDVGTFPKFAKVIVSILIEMLKYMMKKKEPPVLTIGGRAIYQPQHIMKLFGFSARKTRNMRANDEIEYMISSDGLTVFHYEEQVEDYIKRNFVSSRSPEGEHYQNLRTDRFKNTGAKKGTKK